MHVIAHGGAGTSPDDPDRRQAVLEEAVAAGTEQHDPETAVIETVGRLEVDGRFNAGTGSVVQSDGVIRTDAGVMTGDGAAGGACAMPGVEHAVEVARVVKAETPHVLVAGERAVALAEASGVPTDCDLWTVQTRERWEAADASADRSVRAQLRRVREAFGGTDTVGAVATDGERLAAATSTGGRWFALAGRVGDVPQVGAGFYATGVAAASATGEGEAIARFGLARRVVGAVEAGDHPRTAADRILAEFEDETGATAGVIVLDSDGTRGRAHNAEAMQTARGEGEQ